MRRALSVLLVLCAGAALLLLLAEDGSALWGRGATRAYPSALDAAEGPAAPREAAGTTASAVAQDTSRANSDAASAPSQGGLVSGPGEDAADDGSPHGQISGRVVDYDGRPVKGAIVSWSIGCTAQNHTTGEDGRFLLDQAPVTWHYVRVMAPHERGDLFDLGYQNVRVPRAGAEVDAGDLVLPLAATLRVELEEDVETASVTARQIGGEHEATGCIGLVDRRCTELKLPPGRYETLVHADEEGRWAKAQVTLPPEGKTLRLALRAGVQIRARVVDAGGLPVRAAISLFALDGSQLSGGGPSFEEDDDLTDRQRELSFGAGATNDADGHYQSGAQIPGRYRLVAIPLDLSHGRVEATIVAQESAGEVTLVAPASRTITVRATAELGPRARISAWGPPGLSLEETPTGEVQLHGLLPGDRALVLLDGPDGDAHLPRWVGKAWASAGQGDVVVTAVAPAVVHTLAVNGQSQPQGAGYQLRIQLADTQGLDWRAEIEPARLRFGDDEDAERESRIGRRDFVDSNPSIEGYPYDWVSETRPNGGTELVGLVPGRWLFSQIGQAATTVELLSGSERQVRITVR